MWNPYWTKSQGQAMKSGVQHDTAIFNAIRKTAWSYLAREKAENNTRQYLNRIAERLAKENDGVKEAVSNKSDAFKATYQQKFKEIVDKEPDDYYPDAWLVFVYQARPAGEDGLAFLNSGRLHCATAAVVTEGQSIKATTALEQVRSLGGASRITRRTIDNGERSITAGRNAAALKAGAGAAQSAGGAVGVLAPTPQSAGGATGIAAPKQHVISVKSSTPRKRSAAYIARLEINNERERLDFLKELIGAYKASSPTFDDEVPSLTAEMTEVQRSLRRKYAERPPEVASPEAVAPATTSSLSTSFSSLSSGSSSSSSTSSTFRPPLARIPRGANSRRGGTPVPWLDISTAADETPDDSCALSNDSA